MSEVTQADRDAAADWMSTKSYDWGYCGDIRSGKVENDIVQHFASHRIAAHAAGLAAGIAQERERCARIADKESEGFETTQLKYFRELCANTLAVVASRETAERIAAAIRSGT